VLLLALYGMKVAVSLVGVPYYFTYDDDARSHTNQVYGFWVSETLIQ
jgi:hypothetical protein